MKEQSYVGHISLIWDREISYGTNQSYVGQRNLIWERVVLYGTHIGQSMIQSLLHCLKVLDNFTTPEKCLEPPGTPGVF